MLLYEIDFGIQIRDKCDGYLFLQLVMYFGETWM